MILAKIPAYLKGPVSCWNLWQEKHQVWITGVYVTTGRRIGWCVFGTSTFQFHIKQNVIMIFFPLG